MIELIIRSFSKHNQKNDRPNRNENGIIRLFEDCAAELQVLQDLDTY